MVPLVEITRGAAVARRKVVNAAEDGEDEKSSDDGESQIGGRELGVVDVARVLQRSRKRPARIQPSLRWRP